MIQRRSAVSPGHLWEVDADECRSLLRDAVVGRLSWVSADGLATVPVAYGVHPDGRIGVRIGAGGSLARLVESTEVAFEVDDVDPETLTGWSVLVRGTAQAWQGEFPEDLCRPWAPGARAVALQITPQTYTGRSVSAD